MIDRSSGVRKGIGALAVIGAFVLGGCNLGVQPVTYELVDADDYDWPLSPSGMATGDIDGDGDPDAVVTGRSGFAVLHNGGTGAFSLDFPDWYSPSLQRPSLADFDGDDDLDLLTAAEADWPSYAPAIHRNDGAGNFAPSEPVDPAGEPLDVGDVTATDVDNDGDIDVVASYVTAATRFMGVFPNDGTGAFGPATMHPLGIESEWASTSSLTVGDLNDDGYPDVVASGPVKIDDPDFGLIDVGFAVVALNDGAGGFTVGQPLELARNAVRTALTDLDGDGNLDLATGGNGTIATFLGDGHGSFADRRLTTTFEIASISLITPADIDGDGHIDLVAFDALAPTEALIAYGDSAGGIDDTHSVATGTNIGSDGTAGRAVEVVDLDGDEDDDILFLAGSLGVLENASNGRPNH